MFSELVRCQTQRFDGRSPSHPWCRADQHLTDPSNNMPHGICYPDYNAFFPPQVAALRCTLAGCQKDQAPRAATKKKSGYQKWGIIWQGVDGRVGNWARCQRRIWVVKLDCCVAWGYLIVVLREDIDEIYDDVVAQIVVAETEFD